MYIYVPIFRKRMYIYVFIYVPQVHLAINGYLLHTVGNRRWSGIVLATLLP